MSKIMGPFILIICGVLIVVMQYGFIFLLLALMPSIVAYYIDTYPYKTSFKIVAAGNLSAMLPTLMPLIKTGMRTKHYDMSSAMQDPQVWLFVYLGAAAGWCLIYLCRYISRFVVTMSFEYNIKALQNEQKLLIAEWGQEIMQNPRQ